MQLLINNYFALNPMFTEPHRRKRNVPPNNSGNSNNTGVMVQINSMTHFMSFPVAGKNPISLALIYMIQCM